MHFLTSYSARSKDPIGDCFAYFVRICFLFFSFFHINFSFFYFEPELSVRLMQHVAVKPFFHQLFPGYGIKTKFPSLPFQRKLALNVSTPWLLCLLYTFIPLISPCLCLTLRWKQSGYCCLSQWWSSKCVFPGWKLQTIGALCSFTQAGVGLVKESAENLFCKPHLSGQKGNLDLIAIPCNETLKAFPSTNPLVWRTETKKQPFSDAFWMKSKQQKLMERWQIRQLLCPVTLLSFYLANLHFYGCKSNLQPTVIDISCWVEPSVYPS